jgi:hypothetical protein
VVEEAGADQRPEGGFAEPGDTFDHVDGGDAGGSVGA